MAVSDWSTDPASNLTVGPVNIAENCPAANLNNAIREVMAQVRANFDGLGDSFQGKDATLSGLAGLSTAADQLIYAIGANAFAVTALSAFARTILDDPDGGAVCNTIGAIRIISAFLGQPGHIRIQVGVNSFQIAWGFATVAPDGSAAAVYSSPFTTFSIPVPAAMAVNGSSGDSENCGYVNGSATVNGFTIYNANNQGRSVPWIAVGV